MTSVLLKTKATGTAEATADYGTFDLAIVFTELPDGLTALGQAHGYVDALLTELESKDSGLVETPTVQGIFVHPVAGGHVARIDVRFVFTDISKLEEVLDNSGLIGEDVTIVPQEVTWSLFDQNVSDLLEEARVDAFEKASIVSDGYFIALDADSCKAKTIEELDAGFHVCDVELDGDLSTLSGFVGVAPHVTAYAAIEVVFKFKSDN